MNIDELLDTIDYYLVDLATDETLWLDPYDEIDKYIAKVWLKGGLIRFRKHSGNGWDVYELNVKNDE